jgi:hypothetical protein
MTGQLSNSMIEEQLLLVASQLTGFCDSLSEVDFFYQPDGKWSPAQQVRHLTIATKTSLLAFTLPKFLVRRVGGKPNRPSRTYDELVAKYKLKLEQGGKASKRYIPKPVSADIGKDILLNGFHASMKKMSTALHNKWKEHQPDLYIVPHPLLGKITIRELGYFNIYHTLHHLESIRTMVAR